jgi:hypothetical protein
MMRRWQCRLRGSSLSVAFAGGMVVGGLLALAPLRTRAALGAQAATSASVAAAPLAPIADAEFARLVTALSEPGGYFDTDNLISNERSYLHALGALERLGTRGGAFIGVGPDQGFSYIARTRAELAFMVDVRRDNLRQHLLFKAFFAAARNRTEYLALWLGRAVPADVTRWADRDLDAIVRHLDTAAATSATRDAARAAVRTALRSVRVPLDADDLAVIDRVHDAFMTAGLTLRFTTFGRPPRPYYPTLRDLLLETDRDGRRASYMATEADFQYVKELQRRNRIVPVVGDLAGAHALRAIGREMAARKLSLGVLYASNAEDYVLRDGKFASYAQNVLALPRSGRSAIVRSWFGGPGTHPQSVPGYFSTQLVQTLDAFADVARSAPWSYGALVSSPHVEPPR